MNIEAIKSQAEKEIQEEEFRKAVNEYKIKIRERKSLWDRLIPFRILIVRKGNV